MTAMSRRSSSPKILIVDTARADPQVEPLRASLIERRIDHTVIDTSSWADTTGRERALDEFAPGDYLLVPWSPPSHDVDPSSRALISSIVAEAVRSRVFVVVTGFGGAADLPHLPARWVLDAPTAAGTVDQLVKGMRRDLAHGKPLLPPPHPTSLTKHMKFVEITVTSEIAHDFVVTVPPRITPSQAIPILTNALQLPEAAFVRGRNAGIKFDYEFMEGPDALLRSDNETRIDTDREVELQTSVVPFEPDDTAFTGRVPADPSDKEAEFLIADSFSHLYQAQPRRGQTGRPPEGHPTYRARALPGLPDADERRLGVDCYLDGKRLANTLVAQRTTRLEVSFDLDATVQLDRPTTLPFEDVDILPVFVRVQSNEGTNHTVPMNVPRDPRRRAAVMFDVEPVGKRFEALVTILDASGTQVIEAASFTADVVGNPAAAATHRSSFRFVAVSAAAIATPAASSTGSVVTDGEIVGVAPAPIDVTASPDNAAAVIVQATECLTRHARHATGNSAKDLAPALVALAHHGYLLRTSLGLEPLRGIERIQVVATSPQSVLPIELVYDGLPPDDDASVCEGWRSADGMCESVEPDTRQVVCPMRFWGMTKVIEHHVVRDATLPPFRADAHGEREHYLGEASPSGDLGKVLLGASNLVLRSLDPLGPIAGESPDEPAREPRQTLAGLAGRLADPASVAETWADWCRLVGEEQPGVLVALVHQDHSRARGADGLEMGGRIETTFEERHIRPQGLRPGPVVLLIGCDISHDADRITSFAATMRSYAPVVIGTLGEILADDAPAIADALVHQLREVSRSAGSVGDGVRAARRQLLRLGKVAAFQLAMHGDGRWSVGG